MGISTVGRPPSQANSLPSRTMTFRVLFVLVILAHERRRVVHFNVTVVF
jgi:hypothetical protein